MEGGKRARSLSGEDATDTQLPAARRVRHGVPWRPSSPPAHADEGEGRLRAVPPPKRAPAQQLRSRGARQAAEQVAAASEEEQEALEEEEAVDEEDEEEGTGESEELEASSDEDEGSQLPEGAIVPSQVQ